MKKQLYLSMVILTLTVPLFSARAEVAVGFVIGEPTGLSLRIDHFPVLGVAWSMNSWMVLNADYWIVHDRFSGNSLSWYIGAGGSIHVNNSDASFGVRIPLGLQARIAPKLELFGELVPVIYVMPGTGFTVNGGIGLRFIF